MLHRSVALVSLIMWTEDVLIPPLFPHHGKSYQAPAWSLKGYLVFVDGSAVVLVFDGHVEARKPDPTSSDPAKVPVRATTAPSLFA